MAYCHNEYLQHRGGWGWSMERTGYIVHNDVNSLKQKFLPYVCVPTLPSWWEDDHHRCRDCQLESTALSDSVIGLTIALYTGRYLSFLTSFVLPVTMWHTGTLVLRVGVSRTAGFDCGKFPVPPDWSLCQSCPGHHWYHHVIRNLF